MSKRGVPAATTALEGRIGAPPPGAPFLLVTMGGSMRVYPLPDEGVVVVGRDKGCQVRLDHSSISRQHARLRIGKACSLIDLGSRNGTVFHGERLTPTASASRPVRSAGSHRATVSGWDRSRCCSSHRAPRRRSCR